MPLLARRHRAAAATAAAAPAAAPAAAAPTTIPPLQPKHGALIVGGGPAGVAASLALAKLRGWTGVTVVERSHDLSWADPDRSYVYGVDGRGLRCAEMLGLGDRLLSAGVDITSVPLTRVGPDGKASTRVVGTKDPNVATHWMPRAALMKVLAGGLEEFNNNKNSSSSKAAQAAAAVAAAGGDNQKEAAAAAAAAVEVLTSSRVVGLERVTDAQGRARVAVRVEVGGGSGRGGPAVVATRTFYPSLVLGCDGIGSLVRKALQRWAAEDDLEAGAAAAAAAAAGGPRRGRGRAPTFGVRSYPSPASGLRFKVLRLPPNPALRDGATVLRNPSFAVLTGSYKGRPLRMGLLPVRDESMGRTGNVITKPDHPLWRLPKGDARAWRAALAEAFPQADFDALVPEDVMRAFADSEGGAFPDPQASDGVAYVLGGGGGGGGEEDDQPGPPAAAAVLLVGDAAHAFPPDLGQGVNAALQDVQFLTESALADHADSVAPAARAYGAARAPEADALAKLVSFGYPYQYQQAPVRAKLWMLGFLARLALSKLPLVGLAVSPPAFMLVQNTRLSYGEVLRRATATTARLAWAVLIGVVALAAWLVKAGGSRSALFAAAAGGA
jgi:2-polyprenyl-6-methoxyphenol hydroxylase-like FAD-dependent oxidoreductase